MASQKDWIKFAQAPEYGQQMELFKKYQEPYLEKQYGLYEDIFEPQARELGGMLGDQLADGPSPYVTQLGDKLSGQLDQPLSLPQSVWDSMWQQAKGRTAAEYGGARQSATERAAGSGMLGQGPTEKYMQALDVSQAKSLEDIAVDMAIAEWNEKKGAQQTAIQNMQNFIPLEEYSRQQPITNLMSYMGQQPQFQIPMPSSIPYSVGGGGGGGSSVMGGIGTVVGGVAGAMLGGPAGAMAGASIGGAAGGMF